MANHPRIDRHRIVAEHSPPYAPMAMPEQMLERPLLRGMLLTPIRALLVMGWIPSSHRG